MDFIKAFKNEILKNSFPDKVLGKTRFFKAYPGGYAEGDLFLGVDVPDLRKISKKYCELLTTKETTSFLKKRER